MRRRKVKYLGYIARVSQRLYNDYKRLIPLRLIIIYTADIDRKDTNSVIDLGLGCLMIDEAFLIEIDSEEIRSDLQARIDSGETLSEEDLMKLVIYPLTYKGDEAKKAAVSEAIDIVEQIGDETIEAFALSTLFVFADKVISDEDAERIRRSLSMNKIVKIFEEEKAEAVRKAIEKTEKQAEDKAMQDKEDMALNFLAEGDSVEKVAKCTGIDISRVEELADSLIQEG